MSQESELFPTVPQETSNLSPQEAPRTRICESGYEISRKTGRCIKKCRANQVRNDVSGRCIKKSDVVCSSTHSRRVSPVICKSGYEISKKTGRCIKKCGAKQVRNDDTGRCIKKTEAVCSPIRVASGSRDVHSTVELSEPRTDLSEEFISSDVDDELDREMDEWYRRNR